MFTFARFFRLAVVSLLLSVLSLVEYPYINVPVCAQVQPDYAPAVTMLTKRIPEGWIIGGGAFIKQNEIISAKHLDIGTDWCYTTGAMKEASLRCGNIVEVVKHPSLDLVLARLRAKEPSYVAVGQLKTLRPILISSVIDFRVEFSAAYVKSIGNTFVARAGVSRAGDSGSPVFQDGRIVGVVHGDSMVGDAYTPVDVAWVISQN